MLDAPGTNVVAPSAPAPAGATPAPATLPAWQQQRAATQEAPAFGDVVGATAAPTEAPKRKWGLFGRKKDARPDVPESRPAVPREPDRAAAERLGQGFSRPQPPVFLPAGEIPTIEPQPPVRESAFGATGQAHAAPEHAAPAQRTPTAPDGAWAPAPGPGMSPVGTPAAFTPPPLAEVYTPQIVHEAPTSWSPPAAATSTFGDAQPVRNGALDDEVAAMLALRSDIQEQALSELSQLSAYRPTTVSNGAAGAGSLTRRVPTAIPKSPEIVKPDGDRAVNRDAAQLRSRLSSFQSGTSRGRRATEVPTESSADGGSLRETSPARETQDSVIDDDHDSTPSTPSW